MDFLYQYYEYRWLVDYAMFGIILNFISMFVAAIVSVIIALGAPPSEMLEFQKYMVKRRMIIEANTTLLKRIAYNMMIFIPMYGTYINGIFVFYAIKYSSLSGLIISSVLTSKYELFTLVKYDIEYKDDYK